MPSCFMNKQPESLSFASLTERNEMRRERERERWPMEVHPSTNIRTVAMFMGHFRMNPLLKLAENIALVAVRVKLFQWAFWIIYGAVFSFLTMTPRARNDVTIMQQTTTTYGQDVIVDRIQVRKYVRHFFYGIRLWLFRDTCIMHYRKDGVDDSAEFEKSAMLLDGTGISYRFSYWISFTSVHRLLDASETIFWQSSENDLLVHFNVSRELNYSTQKSLKDQSVKCGPIITDDDASSTLLPENVEHHRLLNNCFFFITMKNLPASDSDLHTN